MYKETTEPIEERRGVGVEETVKIFCAALILVASVTALIFAGYTAYADITKKM
ncbi:hypothetical protein SlGVgp132 [Spodoptera litura granulovirus]|uniref:Uncharacterized protein n=1 Tax=Spodoptera litura granulovirus TaxID=359919 RepID=A5IZY4_9BBAC|nr:hypothetical protein SlGVgp132 [Spodoptera litura granulovirus]ABQ52075.1 hypothetical protein SlGVgp132 [Spodoptera litura granulovirus]